MIFSLLTGVLGFEPRNGETKTRCLTAWRHPNIYCCLCNYNNRCQWFVKYFFIYFLRIVSETGMLSAFQLNSQEKNGILTEDSLDSQIPLRVE